MYSKVELQQEAPLHYVTRPMMLAEANRLAPPVTKRGAARLCFGIARAAGTGAFLPVPCREGPLTGAVTLVALPPLLGEWPCGRCYLGTTPRPPS